MAKWWTPRATMMNAKKFQRERFAVGNSERAGKRLNLPVAEGSPGSAVGGCIGGGSGFDAGAAPVSDTGTGGSVTATRVAICRTGLGGASNGSDEKSVCATSIISPDAEKSRILGGELTALQRSQLVDVGAQVADQFRGLFIGIGEPDRAVLHGA